MTDAASRPARDIRVLIADDEALVRAGFKVLVDSAAGLSVVGEASDGVQAVRQTRALKPDVVLMDIRMPVMGGLEATKVILDGGQDPPPRSSSSLPSTRTSTSSRRCAAAPADSC
jgi:DNA-binding NarL/FixJ family response regulator